MKISLIIPAYNEEKYIFDCLTSIEIYGQGLFEVIVIDNASTDKTAEIVKQFSKIRLVYEPKTGLPYARNRGLKEAKGEIVAFIDADSRIYDGWYQKISREFKIHKYIVSFSGPYIYYDVSIFKKLLVWMYWLCLAGPSYFILGYLIEIGNFAAKKSALLEIGGFNNKVPFYGDDTDIAKKLQKIGKVKFSQRFYLYSSARRLKKEGFISSGYKYAINFIWIIFRNKPKDITYKNIR
jgi:glycosyltransferase involved in cell wall biosynthesis